MCFVRSGCLDYETIRPRYVLSVRCENRLLREFLLPMHVLGGMSLTDKSNTTISYNYKWISAA